MLLAPYRSSKRLFGFYFLWRWCEDGKRMNKLDQRTLRLTGMGFVQIERTFMFIVNERSSLLPPTHLNIHSKKSHWKSFHLMTVFSLFINSPAFTFTAFHRRSNLRSKRLIGAREEKSLERWRKLKNWDRFKWNLIFSTEKVWLLKDQK